MKIENATIITISQKELEPTISLIDKLSEVENFDLSKISLYDLLFTLYYEGDDISIDTPKQGKIILKYEED